MWLANWAVLLLLSVLVAEGVHFGGPDTNSSAIQITLALSCSWLAVLLRPLNSAPRLRLGKLILWSVMAASGFLMLLSSPIYFEQGDRNLPLAGGVLILVLLFSTTQSLIRVHSSSHASSMTLFTLIGGVFLAAPLYLAAVAESTSHQILVESIIAVSPLSYLAGIADYDFLRSSWFYQNTPFGGLRFNYPAPGIMTVCYIGITLVLASANILENRSELRTSEQ